MNFDSLFNPKNIAVVGVSENYKKLGSVIFNNILNNDFAGKVYPVNPKYNQIFGHKCYSKVSEINKPIDLMLIAIPTVYVFDGIKDAARNGVKNVIIISGGFSDSGNHDYQSQVVEYCKSKNIRLLGPNCIGVMSSRYNLNATFGHILPRKGDVAFMSQSGAFLTTLADLAEEKNLGIDNMVSFGNKVDINENELLDVYLNDPKIKVIGAYIEDFYDGSEFLKIYNKYKNKKPLILLKAKTSSEAKKAASSHTGEAASPAQTINTALEQNGCILVESIDDMFNTLLAFSHSNGTKGNRIMILSNAGGPAVEATELLTEAGLKVLPTSDSTKDKLVNKFGNFIAVNNPVDILGDADAARYSDALDIILQDSDVDIILLLLTPQYVTEIEQTAKVVYEKIKTNNKPIIPVFLGGKYIKSGLEIFSEFKVPSYNYIEHAVEAIKNLSLFNKKTNKIKLFDLVHKTVLTDKIKKLAKQEETVLDDSLSFELLKSHKFELPKELITNKPDEAINFLRTIGGPVVLKALSKDLVHKTDQKAVYVNIKTEKQLLINFNELKSTISKIIKTDNVYLKVQEEIIGGTELLIGLARDGDSDLYEQDGLGFGHLLVFGTGGIYTNAFSDFAYGLVPMSKEQVEDMVQKTKLYKILSGYRGKKFAINKLLSTIQKLQHLALLYPEISALDFNPVIITEDNCFVADIKIFLKK